MPKKHVEPSRPTELKVVQEEKPPATMGAGASRSLASKDPVLLRKRALGEKITMAQRLEARRKVMVSWDEFKEKNLGELKGGSLAQMMQYRKELDEQRKAILVKKVGKMAKKKKKEEKEKKKKKKKKKRKRRKRKNEKRSGERHYRR